MVTSANPMRAIASSLGLCCVVGVALCSLGCTSMGKPNYSALDTQITKPGMAEAGKQAGDDAKPDSQTFYLEFRGDKKKPIMAKGTLTGPTTIQQAMQKANAFKKYRRLTAEIQRALPNGSTHVLPCEFDLATRRINPQFDYAILPGDKIVVSEDTSTMIDDMFAASLGPMGKRLLGKQPKGKLPSQYKMSE